MSNQYFRFKEFTVWQDRCAMKVTTDACIQAAWTPVMPHVKTVLDIGAGTGLLSLMLAQRCEGINIDAIEVDHAAAVQAKENVEGSPWGDRINVLEGDACGYAFDRKYDLIITNPPFFINSLVSEDERKNRARHTGSLSQQDIIDIAAANLNKDGHLSILLPYPEYLLFASLIKAFGWAESGRLLVSHKIDSPVNRVVALFSRGGVPCTNNEETLVIKDVDGQYTAAFTALLHPFYLYL